MKFLRCILEVKQIVHLPSRWTSTITGEAAFSVNQEAKQVDGASTGVGVRGACNQFMYLNYTVSELSEKNWILNLNPLTSDDT